MIKMRHTVFIQSNQEIDDSRDRRLCTTDMFNDKNMRNANATNEERKQ